MLELHRSEDADALLDALASLLAVPGPDPFTPELVAIPARGVERWLTAGLARALGTGPRSSGGICANVEFPALSRLLFETAGRATGIMPDEDPWPARRSVWPLLEVAEQQRDEPWFAPVSASLERSSGRRFTQLDAIARRYERYGHYRPELLRRWAAGDLTDDERGGWQAPLWQALRQRLATPSPAERLPGACANLRARPELAALPPRLAVFGLRTLPASELELLSALAAHRDLHVFIIDPSDTLWRQRATAPATRASNRLLATWGRQIGELECVIGQRADHDHYHPPRRPATPTTLLRALQAAVVADRLAPGSPLLPGGEDRVALAVGDDSVQVHSCHGAARQVAVLREAILHRLAADPTLECRDILVLCPNVERFAPLVEASFGGEPDDEPPGLPVRIADLARTQTNPLCGVLLALIELAAGRFSAEDLLDFADREPVRARFGFDDDELAQLREWACEAGVHWGIDREDRARYGLANITEGTWQSGLDRLLLAVATGGRDGRPFAGVAPLAQLPSGLIDLAGRVTELFERLRHTIAALRGPLAPAELARVLLDGIGALTRVGEASAWQLLAVQGLLGRIVSESQLAPSVPLDPAEVSALLFRRLRGRPTTANFCSGAITLCGLAPLRALPYRVICLLGFDEGTVPRRLLRDGDDLLADAPVPGDRDARDEDRQLVLEALAAARDTLIVTYTGNDERTNAPRPPALPVGELLDEIDRIATVGGGGSPRDRVRVVHPLAACDPVNFTAGALIAGSAWSFDQSALAGARATIGPRQVPGPPFTRALPPLEDERVITLDELIAFVAHPVRAFFAKRLDLRFGERLKDPSDALPIELDGLARHQIGQRWLDARLRGIDGRWLPVDERAFGTLPPGALARADLEWISPRVNGLSTLARQSFPADQPRSVAARIELSDGTRITGTVAPVRGTVLVDASFARLSPTTRLTAWVKLLALTASDPAQPYRAVLVARTPARTDRSYGAAQPSDEAVCVRLAPLGADPERREEAAREELSRLVSLWRRGMREPLPLPPKATAAYAENEWLAARSPTLAEDPLTAASRQWRSTYDFTGEDQDPEYRLAFGEYSPLRSIGEYAAQLWLGLLEHQTLGHG